MNYYKILIKSVNLERISGMWETQTPRKLQCWFGKATFYGSNRNTWYMHVLSIDTNHNESLMQTCIIMIVSCEKATSSIEKGREWGL